MKGIMIMKIVEKAYMTEIERECFRRFQKIVNEGKLKFGKNEEIKQCLSRNRDGLYYNPYWFVSSAGYVVSVARKNPKILKPAIKFGGKKSKCTDKITDYVRNYGQKIPDGQTPQYYFYKNTYGRGKAQNVPMHHLIVEYFVPGLFGDNVEVWEGHHKVAMDWNKPPQENNNADNLQRLSEELHMEVTKASMLTEEKMQRKIRAVSEKPHQKMVVSEDFLTWLIKSQPSGTPYAICFCDDEGNIVKSEMKVME